MALIERAREIADDLSSQALEKIRVILITLVRRIEIRPDSVQIGVSRSRFPRCCPPKSMESPIGASTRLIKTMFCGS
jgi:hypothetical protein